MTNFSNVPVRLHSYLTEYADSFDIEALHLYRRVQKNWTEIRNITNPSIELQLLALNLSRGHSIQYINDPSVQLQMLAIEFDCFNIQYIQRPSLGVQLRSLDQHHESIRYMNNPCHVTQFTAVLEDGRNIQYITDPDDEIIIASLESSVGESIQYIKNSSQAMRLFAVSLDGRCIRYIPSPNEEVKVAAVKQNPQAVEYITRLSPIVKEAVIANLTERSLSALQYMGKLPVDTQLSIIKRYPQALRWLQYHTKAVQMFVVKYLEAYHIAYIKDIHETAMFAAIERHSGTIIRLFRRETKMTDDLVSKMSTAAVKSNGLAIKYISVNLHTPERRMLAIQQNGWAIALIDNPTHAEQTAAIKYFADHPNMSDDTYIKHSTITQ